MTRLRCGAIAWALLVVGCSARSTSTVAPATGPLDGLIARVGHVEIPTSLVAEVAGARGIEPRSALEDLVNDALASEGARARGLDRSPEAAWSTTSALSRTLTENLWRQAHDQGPPTDDELAELTVVHAVVLRSRVVSEAAALVYAQRIAEAVAGAKTDEEFLSRAKAATREVRTTVERVPPFAVDGPVDEDFMVAAFALHEPGATSPIVHTEFGWHVIRLVSRALPSGADLEARRAALTEAVEVLRARASLDGVLQARLAETHVEILPSADGLMAQATMPSWGRVDPP